MYKRSTYCSIRPHHLLSLCILYHIHSFGTLSHLIAPNTYRQDKAGHVPLDVTKKITSANVDHISLATHQGTQSIGQNMTESIQLPSGKNSKQIGGLVVRHITHHDKQKESVPSPVLSPLCTVKPSMLEMGVSVSL